MTMMVMIIILQPTNNPKIWIDFKTPFPIYKDGNGPTKQPQATIFTIMSPFFHFPNEKDRVAISPLNVLIVSNLVCFESKLEL